MKLLAFVLLAALPALPQTPAQSVRPALKGKTAQVAQVAARTVSSPSGPTLNGQPVRIALGTFYQIERDFDGKLEKLGDANFPIDLLGTTRGVYLDGYGAVFTSEISLLRAPSVNPFHQTISKEEMTQVHKKKIDRLPALREAVKEMVKTAARSLFLVPENQQIVIAVRLDYLQWEDTSGLPGLILMRADRKSALAGDIHHEEQ
jgi:hypothetical protein